MAKKQRKLTKEEVRKPDAFISTTDKIIESINKFKIPIITILAAALLLGSGMVTISLLKKHKENKASQALFPIQNQIDKIRKELKKAEAPPDNPDDLEKQKKNVENKKRTLKDSNEFNNKFATLAKQYESAIDSHLGTSTAIHGVLSLTSLYAEYNMWKESNRLLLKIASNLTEEDIFYGLVHTSIGTTWMETADYEKAIASYEKVLASKKHNHLHGSVLLKKGLSHEKLNQTSQAQAAYEQAIKDHSETRAGNVAKTYLRYMNFKKAL